ncbi:MAG: PAS domain S-box protein, partial [Chitinivibrionales bacterium]|nr:PAS domain S-box protein [Chitinivibrionales bacterium]MBD3355847.1 PAS domain S-box protein [Chitinivibrionales bacterium]
MTEQQNIIASEIAERHRHRHDIHRNIEDRMRAVLADLNGMSREEMQGLVHQLMVELGEHEMCEHDQEMHIAGLAEARDRYRNLFELAPISSTTVDADLIIHKCNTKAVEMLGLDNQRVPGRSFISFVASEDRGICSGYLERVIAGETSRATELRLKRADGSIFYARLECSKISDAATREACLIYFNDITERKRAEESLRASEKRYRFLYQETPTMNLVIDSDNRIAEINSRALHRLGYDREEFVQKPFPDFVAENERGKTLQALTLAHTGQKIGKLEVGILTKFGTVRKYLFDAGSPAVLREERQNSLLLCAKDITERTHEENALRQNESRYRQIVENAGRGVFLLDAESTIVLLNSSTAHMLGFPPEYLRSRSLLDFIAHDDLAIFEDIMARCRTDFTRRSMEIRLLGAKNTMCRVRISICKITAEKEPSPLMVAFCTYAAEECAPDETTNEPPAPDLQMQRARDELARRQQALEAVYAMTTAFGGSLDTLFDLVAMTVSRIIGLPFVAVLHIKDSKALAITRVKEGKLEHPGHILHNCPLLGELGSMRTAYQVYGNLRERCFDCMSLRDKGYCSHVGVPILGPHGELVGAVCSFGYSVDAFSEYRKHLIEIFARYLSHEISRVR